MDSRPRNILLAIGGAFVLPVALFLLGPVWSARFAEKRALEYEVLSRSQIAGEDVSRSTWPDLAILYKNQTLERGTLLAVRFTNVGALPIRAEEYEGPIRVRFSRSGLVLGHRIAQSAPKDLAIRAVLTDTALEVAPMLINPKDAFIVEFMARDTLSISGVTARIAGVSAIAAAPVSKESGLVIERVEDKGFGWSSHSPIARIPALLLACIIAMSFFVGGGALAMAMRHINVAHRVLSGGSAFLSFGTAMSASVVAEIALLQKGVPFWSIFVGLIGLYWATVIPGNRLGRRGFRATRDLTNVGADGGS